MRRPAGPPGPFTDGHGHQWGDRAVQFCGIAALARLNSVYPPPFVLPIRAPAGVCTRPRWHPRCSETRRGAGVPMLAGASRSTPPRVCMRTRPAWLFLPAAQVALSHPRITRPAEAMWHRIQMWEAHVWVALSRWAERTRVMNAPELVEVSCPECQCSPVEVLMNMHSGRRFLWCPQCRAIWAVDIWVLNRPDPCPEPAPTVIAFGPSSGRRPF